eukprot:9244394-Pyramimonas_sp.AAC.1
MTELDGQRKHVQSQLSGLKYLSEKANNGKSIAYMTHYNKRMKIVRRLNKGGFGKELGDGVSRALYAAVGDDEKTSLMETSKGGGKGKVKKAIPFQADFDTDQSFDGTKVNFLKGPEVAELALLT